MATFVPQSTQWDIDPFQKNTDSKRGSFYKIYSRTCKRWLQYLLQIFQGSIIERPKLYVEWNIEAESVEINQGSIVVQGSIRVLKCVQIEIFIYGMG